MKREFHAVLPYPTRARVNGAYKVGLRPDGKPVFYKSNVASSWSDDAMLHLRVAGFRRLPKGHYWLAVMLGLFTSRLDIDAPTKLVIDTMAKALGIDDRQVGTLATTKIHVPCGPAERLELRTLIRPVVSRDEWDELSFGVSAAARSWINEGVAGVN